MSSKFHIANYNLSVRALYRLKCNKITTIFQLIKLTNADLIRMNCISTNTGKEIREFLTYDTIK